MFTPKFILTDVTDTSIKVNGQRMTRSYFNQVFVSLCLNSSWNSFEVSRSLFDAMMAVGIVPKGYGKFSYDYAEYLDDQQARKAALQQEATEHAERVASLHATPEEIAKAVAERKANIARQIQQFRKGSAGF